MSLPLSLFKTSAFVFFIVVNVLFFSAPLYAGNISCKLSFSIVPEKPEASAGGTTVYTISLRNIGSAPCRDAAYSLFYTRNAQYVSATPLPRASDYYWHMGTLTKGQTVTSLLSVRHTSVGNAVIEGCASAKGAPTVCKKSRVVIPKTIASSPPVISTPAVPVLPSLPIATPPQAIGETASSSPAQPHSTQEKGMWIWNFPSKMNAPKGVEQMESLATYGFNTVYITIDDYLDIAILPESEEKNKRKAHYFSELARFVQKANSLRMQVDAEGGARDWAIEKNRWKGFALIDAVKEYNALYPHARIRAFQYDVEPHTLADYERNKSARLAEFIEFVDQSMKRVEGSDLKLSIVIPHFFDGAQAWTPTLEYNGKRSDAFKHLMSIMDRKQGSTIVLMSYRNTFEGANGTKEIAKAEIEEATSGGNTTKIIVGQETGNVDPAFITFYGLTKDKLFKALSDADSAFGSFSGYGGTAAHYLDSFLELK